MFYKLGQRILMAIKGILGIVELYKKANRQEQVIMSINDDYEDIGEQVLVLQRANVEMIDLIRLMRQEQECLSKVIQSQKTAEPEKPEPPEKKNSPKS